MRILLTILLCNLVLGAAMALYLAVIWRKCKSPIAEHGWNPECADPICGNMWLLCFVPIIGILYYLVATRITSWTRSVTIKRPLGWFVHTCGQITPEVYPP